MKRFKNILAVYNEAIGADDALTQAAALARANGAHLTLVDILPGSADAAAVAAERSKRLLRVADALRLTGIDAVSAEAIVGSGHVEIIRRVMKDGHDLVFASAQSAGSLRDTLFGNLAIHLMRKCPCPVWIVKPNQAEPCSRILAAVDPDPSQATDDPLDLAVMDLSTSLASTNKADLHVLHAWDVTGKDRDTISSEVRDETRAALIEAHEDVHRTGVEGLLGRYDLPRAGHRLHLPRGMPEQEIASAATDLEADLVVMGMTSRDGMSGLLFGNMAESILGAVRCGVLVVKPKDFVSPITVSSDLAA